MGIRYGTSSPMVITLAGLAASAARESTAIDNSTASHTDAKITVTFMTSLVTGPDNAIYVYYYGSEDGTNFGGGVTGSDAAVVTTPTNLALIATCATGILTNTPFKIVIESLFSGMGLPRKWGIVVDNRAGAFNATPANLSVTYTPVNLS